jgi:hypothetical protein
MDKENWTGWRNSWVQGEEEEVVISPEKISG